MANKRCCSFSGHQHLGEASYGLHSRSSYLSWPRATLLPSVSQCLVTRLICVNQWEGCHMNHAFTPLASEGAAYIHTCSHWQTHIAEWHSHSVKSRPWAWMDRQLSQKNGKHFKNILKHELNNYFTPLLSVIIF